MIAVPATIAIVLVALFAAVCAIAVLAVYRWWQASASLADLRFRIITERIEAQLREPDA